MAKSFESGHLYEFRGFLLNSNRRVLSRNGEPVALSPKALETLLVLVENSGRVVEKTELISRVWPDSFVEEINLTVHISALRKILGETPDEHRYIVTVPRRGYAFVAPVTEVLEESPATCTAEPVKFLEPLKEATNEISAEILNGISSIKGNDESIISPDSGRMKTPHSRLRIVIISLMGLIMALALFLYYSRHKTKPTNLTGKSIAVLPFQSLSAEEETFELSLADALITRLSNLKQISVRPTSAIFAYANRNTDPIAAGRELNVDVVMQGTVQKMGEQVRLTVQVIRVGDGKPVWANHFDARGTDHFAIQDELSEQVMEEITQKLTTGE